MTQTAILFALSMMRTRMVWLLQPNRLRTEEEQEREQVEAFQLARANGFDYPEDFLEFLKATTQWQVSAPDLAAELSTVKEQLKEATDILSRLCAKNGATQSNWQDADLFVAKVTE